MKPDKYMCGYYLGLIKVTIDSSFSHITKKNILAQLDPHESNHTISITVHNAKGFSLEGLSILSSTIAASDDAIWQKTRYKFSSFEFMITGLKDMRDIHLYVNGDLASQWVWPFRVFGSLLKLVIGHHGYCFLHAAGLALDDGSAALVVAPSGTGKTLTYLNWLCRGRSVYHDDSVLLKDGKIIPSSATICFWSSRYKGGNAIPDSMPEFSRQDLRKIRLMQLIKSATLGVVNLAVHVNIDDYWSNGRAQTESNVSTILKFYRGEKPSNGNRNDSEMLTQLLISDLRFTNLPLLRWINAMITVDSSHPLGTWESQLNQSVRDIVAASQCIELGVPTRFDQDTFRRVESVLCQ